MGTWPIADYDWETLLISSSKPNFATKYALESSRRELHNALLCTALQSQFLGGITAPGRFSGAEPHIIQLVHEIS